MSLQYDPNGKLIDGVQQMQYNGSTYDVVQNNTQGTLLASAARTATVVTANQLNYNAKGIIVFLTVTGVGVTGGLTLYVRGHDPVQGNANDLIASAIVTAAGAYSYQVYPGASNVTSSLLKSVSGAVPRTWSVAVAHTDTTIYTYSVGYQLIL